MNHINETNGDMLRGTRGTMPTQETGIILGYIFYPILWATLLMMSVFVIYNIIDYIKSKPPNVQTLLDKFYIHLLPLVPVALGSSLKTVHYFMTISMFNVIPAVMIIFHNGLRTFFFQKHQKLQQCVTSISDFLSHHGLNIFPPPPEEDIPPDPSENQDPYSPENMEAMAIQAANRMAATKSKHDQAQASQQEQALEDQIRAYALNPRQHFFQAQAQTSQSAVKLNLPNYLKYRENDLPEIVT